MPRELVRVCFDGEVSWGEHIGGNQYRSLNHALSDVEVRYPPDHPEAGQNGTMKRLMWGDIFEGEHAEERPDCFIRPLFIIGNDLTPRETE